jgi:nicotinamide-nucleotide amidase
VITWGEKLGVDLEIICVGNELLIGKVLNTNAQWIGKRATSLGIVVKRITVTADVVEEISLVICEVLARKPRFVVLTGGLGPTFDDLTLQGVARALGKKIVVNEEALKMVNEKYSLYAKSHGVSDFELTAPRLKMAMLPSGSVPVENSVGTAPGVQVEVDGVILVALPGVPSEMVAIFEDFMVPLLHKAAGDVCFCEKSIYVNNMMESVLAPLIDKVMHDNPLVYVKSHPKGEENKPHIELHLSTSGERSGNPQERLRLAADQFSGLIENFGGKVVSCS